jgi:hypothetical protein
MKEITKQMIDYAKQYPDGVNLYDFATHFEHLSDEEYQEALNRAVSSRKLKLKCFSVFHSAK